MAVEFKRVKSKASFINPLKNWQEEDGLVEFRIDPLLGHVSVYSPAIEGKKEILFPKIDNRFIEDFARVTKAGCFLCDGKWAMTTPRYGEHLFSGGRIVKGDVVLFPNLFPVSSYHGVIMLGNEHYRTLDNFPASLLLDAFEVAFQFIRRIFEIDPEIRYFTVNANYLPPAGSSVFHPHVQILGSPVPSTHHGRVLEASQKYFESNNASFWHDLVNTEKALKERYVLDIFDSSWLAAFSPVGTNEITGVFLDKGDFTMWDSKDLSALSKGIAGVLKLYHALGFSSFNFSLFSGTLGKTLPWESAFVRIVCRQNFTANYRTDDYYLQKLMENEIITTEPEELASLLRRLINL